MPESPASAGLPEGKRGGGSGRTGRGRGEGVIGQSGAPSSASGASISGSSSGSSKPPESADRERAGRERERGGAGSAGQRDDLRGAPNRYSSPDLSPGECEAGGGPGAAAAARTGQGSATTTTTGTTITGSGDFAQGEPLDADPALQFSTSGMDAARMQQQLIEYTDSLFLDGLLDEQFTQLQLLQDSSNPDFVSEVVFLFFDDSEKLLTQLTESLQGERIDYKKVDAHVHQFKGSSSSIGAQRVKTACVTFRQCCEEENIDGCRQALAQVKQEFFLVKAKLEAMLAMEQQLLAAGGTLPFME